MLKNMEDGVPPTNESVGAAFLDVPPADEAVCAANPDEPPRLVFEDVVIGTKGGRLFTIAAAEQDESGWWFEHGGRPSHVPHHSVDYLQFTAE